MGLGAQPVTACFAEEISCLKPHGMAFCPDLKCCVPTSQGLYISAAHTSQQILPRNYSSPGGAKVTVLEQDQILELVSSASDSMQQDIVLFNHSHSVPIHSAS